MSWFCTADSLAYLAAAAGGLAGAAIGSVVPIIGTAIGGIVGSIAGGMGGGSLGEWVGGSLGKLVGGWFEDDKTDQPAPDAIAKQTATKQQQKHHLLAKHPPNTDRQSNV